MISTLFSPAAPPALFISHGSPDLILRDIPARAFMRDLADLIPRPTAVLAISAHWETPDPTVDISVNPETIHDFYGFPDALYDIQYPAPGAPHIAEQAKTLLEKAGLGPVATAQRGIDHGVWVPLALPFPEADIPTCQLSLKAGGTSQLFYDMGRALAPLREQGVLIMASGNINHNLSELRASGFDPNAATPNWVIEFRDWMAAAVAENRTRDLLKYRERAPHAERNHPEEDHLMPFFVALGAGDTDRPGRLIHASYDYGVLAMDSFAFD